MKYCYQPPVCQSVCLSVCPLAYPKTTCPNFIKFSIHVTCAVARFSSDSNAILYVLPVLWMTSCFHVMERMGQNQRRRVCFVRLKRSEARYDAVRQMGGSSLQIGTWPRRAAAYST